MGQPDKDPDPIRLDTNPIILCGFVSDYRVVLNIASPNLTHKFIPSQTGKWEKISDMITWDEFSSLFSCEVLNSPFYPINKLIITLLEHIG